MNIFALLLIGLVSFFAMVALATLAMCKTAFKEGR